MNIGFKIYYEKTSGEAVLVIGERSGDVRETTFEEDTSAFPILKNVPFENLGVIKLEYGEFRNELFNSGKIIVENGKIVTRKKPTLTFNKRLILSDGNDTCIISADIVDYFSINEEGKYNVNPLEFSSEVKGVFTITAHSETNGESSIEIEVV